MRRRPRHTLFLLLDPIENLVGDYDRDVVRSRQVAQKLAEAYEFGGAFGHGEAWAWIRARACTMLATGCGVGELGAVVCGDGVEDYEADVVPCDGDGDLVG